MQTKPGRVGVLFDFYDVFETGGEVVIGLTADRGSVETEGCAGPIPNSLSMGGGQGKVKGSCGYIYGFVYQKT